MDLHDSKSMPSIVIDRLMQTGTDEGWHTLQGHKAAVNGRQIAHFEPAAFSGTRPKALVLGVRTVAPSLIDGLHHADLLCNVCFAHTFVPTYGGSVSTESSNDKRLAGS